MNINSGILKVACYLSSDVMKFHILNIDAYHIYMILWKNPMNFFINPTYVYTLNDHLLVDRQQF